MMLGEAGAGKTTLLQNTGLNMPLGAFADERSARRQDLSWGLFDEGVVLDVAGRFILGPGGRAADERGWKDLLRLLQGARPERPVDGVIVAIPASDFILSGDRDAMDEQVELIKRKASVIYDRLREAQKTLGMCFPVYVIVTKCDAIEGYRSFCRELPEKLHSDIWGWSNPNSLESAFTAEWMDDAGGWLMEGLYQIQMELFAERPATMADPDGMFLFPRQFKRILTPLGVCIGHIFRQSVYHEPLFLRGIYFCGDSARGDGQSEVKRPIFVRRLFERKIFPEYRLARPVLQTLISRNRKLLALQGTVAFMVVGGIFGLWAGDRRIFRDAQSLRTVLSDTADDLQQLWRARSGGGEAQVVYTREGDEQAAAFGEDALELLHGMANVSTDRLKSWLIPSSWLSDIHDDIERCMAVGYREIVLKSIYLKLMEKLELLLRLPPAATETRANAMSMEDFPEYIAMNDYVASLATFEKHCTLYNGLQTTEKLDDLVRVVEYLFGKSLPVAFVEHAEYYHAAMKATALKPVHFEQYQSRATVNLEYLSQQVVNRAFHANPVLKSLQELASRLDGLTPEVLLAKDGVMDLRELLRAITLVEALLSRPDFAWLSTEKLEPAPAVNTMMSAICTSAFFVPGECEKLKKGADVAFQQLKIQLTGCQSHLLGPVLYPNDKEGLRLSPRILSMKAALEEYLGMPFMLSDKADRIRARIDPAERLTWDTKLLEEAARLPGPFDTFMEQSLGKLPATLQGAFRKLALKRLDLGMQDHIARAQNIQVVPERLGVRSVEQEINTEVKSYKESLALLVELLGAFKRLDMPRGHMILSDVITAQTSTLLEKVDGLLERENLYGGDFSLWDGEGPPKFPAFGVHDSDELSYYLDLQRERVRHLSISFAEPLVEFCMNRIIPENLGAAPLLFSKWIRIVSEINKYDNKQAGNSLAGLEKFVRFDLGEITLQDGLQKIDRKDLAAPAGDFFQHKRLKLLNGLFLQLQNLSGHDTMKVYGAIESIFNQRLAGRFPFAEVGAGGADGDSEAGVETIRDFFKIYDRYGKSCLQGLKNSTRFGSSGGQAVKFLERIGDVRAFLGLFLDGDEKAPKDPTYDFDVEMRVNRPKELGANRIIEWVLRVGEQEFRYQGEKRQGRWQMGDPVRFSLRWAKDTPFFPASESTGTGEKVEGKTAVYECEGLWALIRFLREHACSKEDFDRYKDPKPHTLRFTLDARTEEGQSVWKTEKAVLTRVYTRLVIMAPDKKEPLVLPEFPDSAPRLVLDTVPGKASGKQGKGMSE